MKESWWKESAVYQIYPRSFKDSNGDGIGDLPGIIEKLSYIKSLGVDVIWICPIYESPNDDNGYDISNYRIIMEEFGSMDDFDRLLEEVHRLEMKLVMDLVPNHTSDEHRWFQESRKSRQNPYRDYYHWQPPLNGGPPNNWPSFFGGSAWEQDPATGDYYLHLFSRKQPDLNWENSLVREGIYDIMKFWCEKGIDGFRIDVISLISKRAGYPDAKAGKFREVVNQYYANGPRVHEFLQEMHKEVLSHYDIMTVGEGPGIHPEEGVKYVGASRKELNMIFHFDHMSIDYGPGGKNDPVKWELPEFKKIVNTWDAKLHEADGWGSIFLGNHDYPRIVSRFGNDKKYWKESAKLLVTLLFTLRGTAYIYQGDEIGMTNVAYPAIEYYRDIETLNSWKEAMAAGKSEEEFLEVIHYNSRDNARTPMQWDDSAQGGFSEATSWIPMNPNHKEINVASQEEDPNSILNYYRRMIHFRKQNPTLTYGEYKCLLKEDPDIYAFERWDDTNRFLILLNFSDRRVRFEPPVEGMPEVRVHNYAHPGTFWELRPWEAKVIELV
ncbi:MAG TPA: alpha-glucosidase [Balneolaceae bacterium]